MNKEILIVHLYNDFSGSTRVLSDFIGVCEEHEIKIKLITNQTEGHLSSLNVEKKIISYNSKRGVAGLVRYMLFQIRVFSLIFVTNSDVILINTLLPFGAGLAGAIRRKRIIYYVHTVSWSSKILEQLIGNVAKMTAKRFIFVSNYVSKYYNIDRTLSFKIYNPLPKINNEGIINTYEGDFTITMIASLKTYKGIEEFLKVASYYADRNLEFQLVLNCNKRDYELYFDNRRVPSNTTIHRNIADLYPFYAKTKLLLNLSHVDSCIETFGMTIIEAMSFGIPVIAPPIGGPAEIITHGEHGYLLDSKIDLEEIISKIFMLSNNFDQWNYLSRNCVERSKDFSYEYYRYQIKNNILLPLHLVSK